MNDIFGKNYASIYDTLYADVDFAAEVAAIVTLVGSMIPTINKLELLDLGCGTGNHITHFKDSFQVTGVDLSDGMLEIAKSKHPDVSLIKGDARTFNLDRQFDVVVMMSAVLGYQHSNEHVLETLRNVRRHLKPGGLFIFDTWYGPAILLERPAPKLKELTFGDIRLLRSMKPNLCVERNSCVCHYKWWIPVDGKLEIHEECHMQRYFFPMEISLMLELAGLQLRLINKAGHAYRPIDDTDRDVMFVVRG